MLQVGPLGQNDRLGWQITISNGHGVCVFRVPEESPEEVAGLVKAAIVKLIARSR